MARQRIVAQLSQARGQMMQAKTQLYQTMTANIKKREKDTDDFWNAISIGAVVGMIGLVVFR